MINEQITELRRALDGVNSVSPWLRPVSEQAARVLDELAAFHQGNPQNSRKLSKSALLVSNVVDTLEKVSGIKDAQDNQEVMSVVRKLPVYLNKISEEVSSVKKEDATTGITANIAPLEHHFGNVEGADIPLIAALSKDNEEFEKHKKNLLSKLPKTPYLDFPLLLKKKIVFSEYAILEDSYVKAGHLEILPSKSFGSFVKADRLNNEFVESLSGPHRVFLKQGEERVIPKLTPFWVYDNIKESPAPVTFKGNGDNHRIGVIITDRPAKITGPAVFGTFAPEVLKGVKWTQKSGFFGGEDVILKSDAVQFHGMKLYGDKKESSGRLNLGVLCCRETIEASVSVYDKTDLINGTGDNTRISYEVHDENGLLAKGHEIIMGKLRLAAYEILLKNPFSLSDFGFINPLHLSGGPKFTQENAPKLKIRYTGCELTNDKETIKIGNHNFTQRAIEVSTSSRYYDKPEFKPDAVTVGSEVFADIGSSDLGVCAEITKEGKILEKRYSLKLPPDPAQARETQRALAAIAVAEGSRISHDEIGVRVFGIRNVEDAHEDIPSLLASLGRSPDFERFSLSERAKEIINKKKKSLGFENRVYFDLV